MKSLFARTLLAFMAALLALFVVLAIVLGLGFSRSFDEWTREKTREVEGYARAILEGRVPERALSIDTPLFVYDADRNLVWSNRGRGRRSQEQAVTAVVEGGSVRGYYYSGGIHFGEDAANQRLLASLGTVLGVGFALSPVVALGFALYFARGLSRPARRVAAGLARISEGKLNEPIPEAGAAEIAQIARAANRLQAQLAAEREIRKQWAQDVAHDLRTPIAALKAQFEGMRDGVLPATPQRIERTYAEIERVERLVSALDELSRLESPEMKLQPASIDAARLLDDGMELWAHRVAEKQLRVEKRAAVASFVADDTLVRRALANFLSNAVRHAEPGGVLRLSIEREAPWIVIRVFNAGQAVPECEIERVFERLYRGEYARSSPGSGLGLTIARRIAELHGGSVLLIGRQGEGTTVEMRLPDPTARQHPTRAA